MSRLRKSWYTGFRLSHLSCFRSCKFYLRSYWCCRFRPKNFWYTRIRLRSFWSFRFCLKSNCWKKFPFNRIFGGYYIRSDVQVFLETHLQKLFFISHASSIKNSMKYNLKSTNVLSLLSNFTICALMQTNKAAINQRNFVTCIFCQLHHQVLAILI